MGLYPQKGTIAVGSDADIVIWDPEKETTITAESMHMRVDYSPFEGRKVTGFPETVLLRGQVVVDGDSFRGRPGQGKFIKRASHAVK
jgi:dihydropyrimidinase